MKLIPKAKPVRIRINSGGLECKDLNDLRRSFNVDDLRKIESRQLIKWLNQVDGGATIARELDNIERLNGNQQMLKYYRVFFHIPYNDLFQIWKKLTEKGFDRSADLLGKRLLEDGDSRIIIETLSGKNDLEKCHFILSSSDSSIRTNSKLFLEIGERVSKLHGDKGEIGRDVLSRLAGLGVKEAEQNLLLTPQEFMSLLDSFFDRSTEDFEVAINANLGRRVNMLKGPLRNFAEAIFLGFVRFRPMNAITAITNKVSNFTQLPEIARYVHYSRSQWEKLSSERLFILGLLLTHVERKNDLLSVSIFSYLKNKNYIFAQALGTVYNFLNSYANSLPKDMCDIDKGRYFSSINDYQNISNDVYVHFIRLYFRHFLEPQYHHGDLSNI